MKGQEVIYNIVQAEMPDMEQIRRACINQAENNSAAKQKNYFTPQRLIPAAACFLVLLVGAFVYVHYNNADIGIIPPQSNVETSDPGKSNNDTNNQAPSGGHVLSENIKGLPVENFSLQKLNLDAEMCRAWAWAQVPDFFAEEHEGGMKADSFVIVKVTDIQTETPTTEYIEKFGEVHAIERSEHRQTSTVSVLEHIWGEATPQNFQIVQWDHSYSSIGPTNMLRKGGVYLLPLQKYGGNGSERLMDEEYSVAGDLDVLFEIDDTGHVFSHSDFSGFNHYDGKPYTALADAIVNFAENPDFSLVGFHFLER